MSNPFFYGNIATYENFLNRDRALNRVFSRIKGNQSSAVIGQPRIGKTSFLNYICSPENRNKLVSQEGKTLIFSLLDVHMFSQDSTVQDFWRRALEPIENGAVFSNSFPSLLESYKFCQSNHYSNFALQNFFKITGNLGIKFVLLIDEFEALVHYPIIGKGTFYSGLRSLASRSNGSFILVVASRYPIHKLNIETQNINRTGSPFFNILSEVTLGGFPDKDIAALLRKGERYFSFDDRAAIRYIAGRHPYLLQATASSLWDAYEERNLNQKQRWLYMADRVWREQRSHFHEIWSAWSPEFRKAFMIVALLSGEDIVTGGNFSLKAFESEMHYFLPELQDLKYTGLITHDEGARSGYRVESAIMFWWLTYELVRVRRSEKADESLERWLQLKQIKNGLTLQQREDLSSFIAKASNVLSTGVTKLVESFAEGLV